MTNEKAGFTHAIREKTVYKPSGEIPMWLLWVPTLLSLTPHLSSVSKYKKLHWFPSADSSETVPSFIIGL